MKSFLRLLLLYSLPLGAALAQQSAQEPLPPGPPLANPEFAHWHIAITTSQKPEDTSVEEKPIQSIEVIKTQNIVHEHTVDPTGATVDKWYKGSLAYMIIGQQKNPGIPKYEEYRDYIHHDFPELSFVVPANYLGTDTYEGRKCLVFQGKPHVTPSQGESDQAAQERAVETTAYIDIETRLPVATKAGSTVSTYTFDARPSMLVFPPQLEDLAKTEQQELQHISTPHGSGFVP